MAFQVKTKYVQSHLMELFKFTIFQGKKVQFMMVGVDGMVIYMTRPAVNELDAIKT